MKAAPVAELAAPSRGGFWTAVAGLICIYANECLAPLFPDIIQADPGAVGRFPDPASKLAS